MINRRSAAAHVFALDVRDPVLSDEDRHHLGRVLRLRPGEIVTVSDGRGSWRPFSISGSDADLVPAGDVETQERFLPTIAVAFAVPKGERPELVIQKLTELGIDHIFPVITERTIVRWDEMKIQRNHDRMTKVGREAAMQSRAVYLPHLHPLVHGLGELLDVMTGRGLAQGLALAEPEGQLLTPDVTSLIIGPEGGFTPAECAMVRHHVALPGGILRAETAAMTAGALLAHQRQQAQRRIP